MDARQRLNQLRRHNNKSKFNRNKAKKRLTDLRELIVRNDNKIIKRKNTRISVKTRIGFKNNNQTKRHQLIGNKNGDRIGRKSNVR